jgi:RNA polymerase sigma-70 factor (ECF subfamily)
MELMLPPADLAHCSDDDLMRQVRDGEVEDAFPILQRRYGRDVRRLVQSIVREPSMAADVATEAMEKIWIERAHYEPGTNFRAWLLGVARNHALTALRSMRRAARIGGMGVGRDSMGTSVEACGAGEGEVAEQQELSDALALAVAELPDRYRLVFDLCVQQHRPYAEVSDRMHLPKGTIAIRIRRARQRLFGSLAPKLDTHHVRALANHYATCA